ncbi:hypothetical protein Dret_1026 [Desulfohalobium retbaense DSM 5692]|uniref:Uncharacterized protein n=1 Tax=Desulfohalobium retbaense (strain ATCC 49708 / DSM 5692 / JCM 16813 / HR100) TaxID=485915 RepID=C8X1Z1_DESRD|nr:hypothetical protein Dret_1026 [Desulfohalobium retbaense DSM 5692]
MDYRPGRDVRQEKRELVISSLKVAGGRHEYDREKHNGPAPAWCGAVVVCISKTWSDYLT